MLDLKAKSDEIRIDEGDVCDIAIPSIRGLRELICEVGRSGDVSERIRFLDYLLSMADLTLRDIHRDATAKKTH